MTRLSISKILPIAFGLGIVLAGIWVWSWARSHQTGSGQTLPVLGEVQNFSLLERSGKLLSDADLRGSIWIADFIFTSCPGPCPRMSARMSQLQTALAPAEEVRLVSFTVDPERDTPEVLSRYAERYEALPGKWFFLTGDKSDIYDFARASLNLSVREDPGNAHFIHSTQFVLIDKTGRIRGYYDSMDNMSLGQLVVDIERLRQEGGKQ